MSRKDNDPLVDAPSITPSRDEIASFQRNKKSKAGLAGSLGSVPDSAASTSSSTGIKAVLVLLIIALLGTAAVAGFLQQRLSAAESTLLGYEQRLASLEERLSVTDESMSESSVAMQVKLRELDGEVRKLWDNVWKRSKQRFAVLETQAAKHDASLKNHQKVIDSAEQRLTKNKAVMDNLAAQLQVIDKLRPLIEKNNKRFMVLQSSQETNSDKVNSLSNKVVKLDRAVKDSAERLDSVDAFRRQVNGNINTLRQNIGALQGAQ